VLDGTIDVFALLRFTDDGGNGDGDLDRDDFPVGMKVLTHDADFGHEWHS
jgi:hypothetical protein